jgi:hypothetical protein
MKWQAIASVTSQINEEAKGYLARKLQKDASVEIPNLWADFITDTSRHLHKSQSNLEVTSNDKTGGLGCLTSFDESHEDFLDNRKPFLDYVLSKYDERAAGILSNVRNPYTKRFLREKIGSYRVHLTEQVTSAEVKLIDGKRHSMATEALEKLKKATYDNPELYNNHLQDSIAAINPLSLFELEKDKMLLSGREELAWAAALGTIRQSPNVILDPNVLLPWKEHLSFEQRVRLEQQASSLLHHRQVMMQGQVKQLVESHFASILKTGQEIKGFDNLLHSSFDASDPKLHHLLEKEALHKEAFLVAEQLKAAPLAAGNAILAQIAPKAGDHDYAKRAEIYRVLRKDFDEQVKTAKNDPAKFVEDLFSDDIPADIPLPQRLLLRKQLQEQKGVPAYGQKYLMKDEREDYLARLQLPDANEIKRQLDNISSIGGDNFNLGNQLLDEILQAEKGKDGRRLSALTNLYVTAYLHKDHGLMHDTARAIAMQGQLFGEFASDDEKIIKNTIRDSGIMQDFEHLMLHGTPDNAMVVEQLKENVLNLARFYQHQKHLKPAKATEQAIERLVTENYIKPIDDLYLPAKVIEDGRLVEINSDYLNYNLSKLRADLIHDRLPVEMAYDKTHSFGLQYNDERQLVLDKRIKEVLREGQFKLTPDQKYIYFIYYDEHGAHNLLTAGGNIWHVSLTTLNNPPSGEDILRQDLEQMHELFDSNPVTFRH